MTRHARQLTAAMALAALVSTGVRAHADDASLTNARELYAAAAYSDALALLDGLLSGNHAREERQSIELYRILCLVALGRKADADRAVDAMIARDPLYRPGADDVPPRLRSAFGDARRRLLPPMIQQHYADAKTAYDKKDFAAAAFGFQQVLIGLGEPDIAAEASQAPLSDLKTLADGFLALSRKAIEPPPAPAAPAAPMPAPNRIYTIEDADVTPPVTLRQMVPPFRGKVMAPGTGIIEVVIGTTGAVESARMSTPLLGMYDSLVISAAKTWQYEPATVNGVPVRFKKFVKVNLVATPREE